MPENNTMNDSTSQINHIHSNIEQLAYYLKKKLSEHLSNRVHFIQPGLPFYNAMFSFREKWETCTYVFLLYPSFGDCLFLNEWSQQVPGGVLWWCFTGVWSLVTSPNPVTVSDSQPASTRQAGVTECTAAEVYFLYFSASFNRISHVECQVTHNWAAAIQLECQNVQLYTKQLKRFSHLENISRQLKNWKCSVELLTKYKCLAAIDSTGIE